MRNGIERKVNATDLDKVQAEMRCWSMTLISISENAMFYRFSMENIIHLFDITAFAKIKKNDVVLLRSQTCCVLLLWPGEEVW